MDSTTFEINDFGNNTTCSSIKDLQNTLITKYANRSVSIGSINSRGSHQIIGFVDVKNKQVYDSYGNKDLFNFDTISEKRSIEIEKAKKILNYTKRSSDNIFIKAFIDSKGDNQKFIEHLKNKFSNWETDKTGIIRAANEAMNTYGIDVEFNFRQSISPEKIENYRDLNYQDLPSKNGKKMYLSGQLVYGRKRKELLIDNDYVLTDDNGRYIDTKKVLSRDYLISLSQKEIQGNDNPKHVYLPLPRAEAELKKLKAMPDKNNIDKKLNKGFAAQALAKRRSKQQAQGLER